MAMMKVCSGCWHAFPVTQMRGSKCPSCSKVYERDKSRRRRRTAKERTRRQEVIAAHIRVHGWVCPGYERPAHEAHDLTADHIVPVAKGGSEEGEVRVLCRSCNSRRGAGSTRPVTSSHPLPIRGETHNDLEPLVG